MASTDDTNLTTALGWRKQKLAGLSGRNFREETHSAKSSSWQRSIWGKAELMESVGGKLLLDKTG